MPPPRHGSAPHRAIIHVDMDAFFAAVEQRDRPELRGKPILVGGDGPRGVVSTASYEARPFGVGSAMPMTLALRRCPNAIVVRGRMERYREVSREVFDIFRRYTPLVEGLSLDEAFLDVTHSGRLYGTGEDIARRIKEDIKTHTGLTASAGVSRCKFVSKIASDLKKPDGLVVVPPDSTRAFLAALPIKKMWGVGPKSRRRLESLGYTTFAHLADADVTDLVPVLGKWASTARDLARGRDERPVVPERERKGMSAETTFERDLTSIEPLEQALLAQCQRVAERLCRQQFAATAIVLKVKWADFRIQTRQRKLPPAVFDTQTLFRTARALLRKLGPFHRGIRLIGVGVNHPPPETTSGSLFETLPGERDLERRQNLQHTLLQLNDKYGPNALTHASLLRNGRKPPPTR